jgi:hypothetical protein
MEASLILAADLPDEPGQAGNEISHPDVGMRRCVLIPAHIEPVPVPRLVIEDLKSAPWQMLLG